MPEVSCACGETLGSQPAKHQPVCEVVRLVGPGHEPRMYVLAKAGQTFGSQSDRCNRLRIVDVCHASECAGALL